MVVVEMLGRSLVEMAWNWALERSLSCVLVRAAACAVPKPPIAVVETAESSVALLVPMAVASRALTAVLVN